MKDIKSLYLAARNGRAEDIASYTEAVNELVENKPSDYLPHLEYIISSSIGVATFLPFVEKYGIPIAAYDDTLECFENCRKKCNDKSQDDSAYTECIEWLNKYRADHINGFAMYEYYSNGDNSAYTKTYYSSTNGHQNRLLAAGMIKRFGECAIPDIMITAGNDSSINTVLEYVYENYTDQILCEWMHDVIIENVSYDYHGQYLEKFAENSASVVVENMRDRNHQIFREAMIMDNPDLVMEYTDGEIEAIRNLIAYKEYRQVWMDEISPISITESQNEIYSLYEELDGIVNESGDITEEVSDSVIPMKPTTEDTWYGNTHDKKTGKVPDYISNNHDMAKYGEDDDEPKKKKKDEDGEPTLDDYRRPSADKKDDVVTNDDDNDEDEEPTGKPSNGSTNNYYYYTYTNSLNKNTNSYNKDFSRRDSHNDDHSTHDDHSTDDHSRVINSHNNKKDEDVKKESTYPWTLNITDSDVIMEDVGDADDNKPESDHPVKDALMDLDRKRQAKSQELQRKAQGVKMAARAAVKPITRTRDWITNLIAKWKDIDETNIKEKMADPHARSSLLNGAKKAIIGGSLLKAGILLNPVFLFLGVTRLATKKDREFRIRNNMIGEIKSEIEIVEEKIKDAERNGDNKAKYQLMRFKNELNKKLLRVGGNKEWKKII